ncbi:MAG: cupin domain-containing protein [Elainella sp. C42_A2020_010]|nr:cupin domain-containing protein [Elainella sp. C42_A2020_010]
MTHPTQLETASNQQVPAAETTPVSLSVQLKDQIDYSKPGVTRKVLIKDQTSSFMLMCITAGTVLPEHTAPRNVSLTILEGYGCLTIEGKEVRLEAGVFVYMPANTPHSLRADENLAFLHT